MTVFEYSDYRYFLRNFFEKLPKRGRGKLRELAKFLRIHPTVVSQTFAGLRDFSEEQALEICDYLLLSPMEAAYFRLLVRLARAGTPALRDQLKAEVQQARQAARALSTRVATEKFLSDTERAVFYSSWLYSACRLYCSTAPQGRGMEEIAERFGLPRVRCLEIMQFLQQAGLSVQENDKYKMGAQSTFVERGSPFLPRHHSNWRIKAIQAAESLSEEELMFTGPFSISRADFSLLRERLAGVIQDFSKLVKDSPSEEVACLNLDFFWVKK